MQRGFSLVELSIVLVILGLLTGGILAGQSLIRAAELRSISTEHSKYISAIQGFRDKYLAIPGDMSNATKFWGALDGNDGISSDCRIESTTLLTCNGNGSGLINAYHTVGSAQTNENYLIWQHLAQGGLIEGKYTGSPATLFGNTACGTGNEDVIGCNTPGGKMSNSRWYAFGFGTLTGDASLFDGNYGNAMYLSVYRLTGPLVRPEELWNIDTKMDDGKPGTGNVVTTRWNTCATGAATVADGAIATYNLTSTTTNCVPVFRNAF